VQILGDVRDEAVAAAAGVDILDPQQEATAARARQIMRSQRRESVAKMQPSGRARREARDDRAAVPRNRHAGP